MSREKFEEQYSKSRNEQRNIPEQLEEIERNLDSIEDAFSRVWVMLDRMVVRIDSLERLANKTKPVKPKLKKKPSRP